MFAFIYWLLLGIVAVPAGIIYIILGEGTRDKIYGGVAILMGLMFLGTARSAWKARKEKNKEAPKT